MMAARTIRFLIEDWQKSTDLTQKYCDTHLYDRPWLEGKLKEEGLPVLVVDHSDIGWVGGKFKTMVQAFIEMVG